MKDPAPKFWDTCFSTPITACVTFEVGFNDQFSGRWRTDLFKTSEPIRITAWGLKFPGKAELNVSFGDAAWNAGNPLDFGWNDFNFVMFTNEWDFAVGGEQYEGLGWQGNWVGRVPPIGGTRFAWRGETEDHSLVFDCVQKGPGNTRCEAFTANTAMRTAALSTTVAPEPSTFLLVLTGLLLWRYARRLMG